MTFLLQAVIALTSATALLLIDSLDPRVKRAGFLIGLAGQPAWWFEAVRGGQWGVLFTAVLFTAIYANGVRRHWRGR